MTNPFQSGQPNIIGNAKIRTPQVEAYQALEAFAAHPVNTHREAGIVLPVGCGKSGTITLTPFAFKSKRALVIAPNVPIAQQLKRDFDPTNMQMFYQKCGVLTAPPFPEPAEIRGTTTNKSDLDEAHVVITNIQQLQGGDENRWLQGLPADYFDLILFDEGHHSVAESYTMLKAKFPNAKIINFSATPLRADGQLMAGNIIYSFPIFRAIQAGYVKQLKAVQLNPRTLSYVRREDGQEIEVDLAEVRRLGETDADFRRSIVTSEKTLNTIVDASIRELDRLRTESGNVNLKIIASALNFEHCGQIVQAYASRGKRAAYVHSREDGAANKRVMAKLEAHELDVIVQVRKLGEGFDHPHLAVAAVFSIFSNLSPFVQFVGRIMRVLKQNEPNHILNRGVVVFHAGANIARQWSDFQNFSEADQAYFDQLFPLEDMDPAETQRIIEPAPPVLGERIEVREQSDVLLEEIPLLQDVAALAAIKLLRDRGYSTDEITAVYESLIPVPTTRAHERQALRAGLDTRIKTEAARTINARGMNPAGSQLDTQRLGRSNLIVLKAAIDKKVNALVGKGPGERSELSRAELDQINNEFDRLVAEATEEVFVVA